ncbi:MAG: site-2 protease family protein [Candidatus Izemoplasmatales bacterium]|nr:site-2 protease family protein [Candidatus Izemoplasmatales bacterium]
MLMTLNIFLTIWNIILFLLVLGLVICIHELGHLFFAKKAGILCHEFAFGMGPRLFSIKKGETVYSIRAIPFGGFASMSGEELEEELIKVGDRVRLEFDEFNMVKNIILNEKNHKYQDLLAVTVENIDLRNSKNLFINQYQVKEDAMYIFDKKEMQIAPTNRRFSDKTKWQRFLTTFGGPMMNFVLALVIFLIIAFSVGVPNSSSTVIGEVSDNAPAADIILPGDKIISINGVTVDSWNDEGNSISSELAKTIDGYVIVVERDGELITLEEIQPQLIFYGLGFTSYAVNDDLIIDMPLYLKTELKSGDQIISFNDIPMTTWQDVIDFAENNVEGSSDKEDLYKITVYRQTISEHAGLITNITLVDGFYNVRISASGQSDPVIYTISESEDLLVHVGDMVEKDTALGGGGNYDFEYILYGEKILKAMNATPFSSRIGIGGTTKFSFFGAIGNGFVLLKDAAFSIFGTLGLLFTSNLIGISDLSGFVGIFSMTSNAAAAGIISLLSFVGLLSVNLGIINLLPIPALDGGRLVFIGYEAITKKKPNQKLENWLHTIVFFLLIALMLYVTYNDILRLIGI